jgi:hypothetical protein
VRTIGPRPAAPLRLVAAWSKHRALYLQGAKSRPSLRASSRVLLSDCQSAPAIHPCNRDRSRWRCAVLIEVAMRASGVTNLGLELSVVSRTNAMIACFARRRSRTGGVGGSLGQRGPWNEGCRYDGSAAKAESTERRLIPEEEGWTLVGRRTLLYRSRHGGSCEPDAPARKHGPAPLMSHLRSADATIPDRRAGRRRVGAWLCGGVHSGQERILQHLSRMERTLGFARPSRHAPHWRANASLRVLTTATTRPSQSRTGAPKAP